MVASLAPDEAWLRLVLESLHAREAVTDRNI
jgi:hypothetical protein